MPFAKNAKATPTYFRARSGALTGSVPSIDLPFGLQANKECVVQLLRSHLRLTAREWHTPRGRSLRSRGYWRAISVWKTRRGLHGLLRQASFVFGPSFLVSASLALRNDLRKAARALPVNKAFQRDKFAVSHLLQKAQKLRHGKFAAEQNRYAFEARP
jgi:hypothetical protein